MLRRPPSEALLAEFTRNCAARLPSQPQPELCRSLASQLSAVLELDRGETLAHAGAQLQSLYLLASGAFKSVMLGEDGSQQVVYFYWPGELMELNALAARRYLTDVVAVAPSRVYELPMQRIERLGQLQPRLLESLLEHVSDRLAEAERSQYMLGSLNAAQRMAFLLTDTLQRREHAPALPLLPLPMNRGELASYLGIAPETVSRLLGWFRRQGIIRMQPGRVVEVLDAPRMHEILLGEAPGGSPLSALGA